jgi:hypothetical protein
VKPEDYASRLIGRTITGVETVPEDEESSLFHGHASLKISLGEDLTLYADRPTLYEPARAFTLYDVEAVEPDGLPQTAAVRWELSENTSGQWPSVNLHGTSRGAILAYLLEQWEGSDPEWFASLVDEVVEDGERS